MDTGTLSEGSTVSSTHNVKKVKFSSTFTTLLTLLGYSIGTSDFWRFPFLTYRNGGGAFLIPFMLSIVVIGMPIYLVEYSISKFSGKGIYNVWDIAPFYRGCTISILIAYSVYIIYMAIFRCWMTEFLVQSFQSTLPWSTCDNAWNTVNCTSSIIRIKETTPSTTDFLNTTHPLNTTITAKATTIQSYVTNAMSSPEEFWQYHVLDLSSGIDDFGNFQWKYVLYHLATRVIVALCCYKSVKSIEKVMFLATLCPVIIVTCIFVRSVTLPGATEGIRLFVEPDFNKLADPRVWTESSLMAFYTLAFGWGAIVALGAHANFRQDSVRTAMILPVLDALSAMYFGMVCFSVLGNMAHSSGIPIKEVISAGMSIGMVAYPHALASLPFPQIWCVLFFIAVQLQGIDGQIIGIEMLVQVVGDMFPSLEKRRIFLLILINTIMFILAFPLCTSAGAYIFLYLDWYIGVFVGPCIGLGEIIIIAWVYGGDRFSHDISLMIGRPVPALFRVLLAYITPILMLGLLIIGFMKYVPPTYGEYHYPDWSQGVGWMMAVLVILPTFIHAARSVIGGDGSLMQNLKRSFKPTPQWGPAEDAPVDHYDRNPPKRPFRDLMMFNLIGRYRKTDKPSTAQEMALLS